MSEISTDLEHFMRDLRRLAQYDDDTQRGEYCSYLARAMLFNLTAKDERIQGLEEAGFAMSDMLCRIWLLGQNARDRDRARTLSSQWIAKVYGISEEHCESAARELRAITDRILAPAPPSTDTPEPASD